ncbi:phospholipase D-like domain-containing protein [Kaarinaea lacus]
MHLQNRLIPRLTITVSLFLYIVAAMAQPGITQTALLHNLPQHANQTGAYVLEKGEESLLARAWLSEQAQHSIDVQYFIWSNDNIGILATEALLNAADRGVRIRVIVDDLLVDADDEQLLAFSAHPNINIKIYNPQHRVGVSLLERIFNLFTGFRQANQRMHDKVVLYDGQIAIIGGRNMADEYYDYDNEYNFRDRDVLLAGSVTQNIKTSFQNFWGSSLSVAVDSLIDQNEVAISEQQINAAYQQLHDYAQDPENFAPHIRQTLSDMTPRMKTILENLFWGDAQFVHDLPGKNPSDHLEGGGQSTSLLIDAVKQAQHRLTIQSPYLIIPKGGEDIFAQLLDNGVSVQINTNSLASTDNLYAFSGYQNQRDMLLQMGINIFEYKPYPAVQKQLFDRLHELDTDLPIFAVHAKTMVIDSQTLFIGTFNLDPRSAHLNTEIGVLIHNPQLAAQVEQQILTDMQPENSWNAKTDSPDAKAPWLKRVQVFLLSFLPIEPLL